MTYTDYKQALKKGFGFDQSLPCFLSYVALA